jgi:hypothetical protein
MKTLLKLAVGAAIAGAFINLMMRKRAERDVALPRNASPTGQGDAVSSTVVAEDLKGENAEWGGGSSGLNA